jgi:metal transporter CNNM
VGREGIRFIAERELGELILRHAGGAGSDISDVEARGAVNFLALDDVKAGEEGEPLDPASIVTGWVRGGSPALPSFERSADDPFLRELARSGRKWVVLLDEQGEPAFVVNAPWVLRRALFSAAPLDALEVCRRPVVTHDPAAPLDGLLQQLKARGRHASDDVIDVDLILLWSPGARRIITGSDLLGRLLRGIARRRSGR